MKMESLMSARERAASSAFGHGLAILTAMTAAEIFTQASAEQAHGFYLATGRRLATIVDLTDVQELDDLAARANALWSGCGLGHVEFEAVDTGIRILHRGAPAALDGDRAGHWVQLLPALLVGAYDTWFRQLGSGPALTTRILREGGDTIELHHGG